MLDDPFFTLSKKEALTKANKMAQKWFIASLNNKITSTLVFNYFPRLKVTDPLYKIVANRVCGLFKTWKNRTLSEAASWFNDYTSNPANRHFCDETDFKTLKSYFNQVF